jgi:hypothetical protein
MSKFDPPASATAEGGENEHLAQRRSFVQNMRAFFADRKEIERQKNRAKGRS